MMSSGNRSAEALRHPNPEFIRSLKAVPYPRAIYETRSNDNRLLTFGSWQLSSC
jgi:hypothetical protein